MSKRLSKKKNSYEYLLTAIGELLTQGRKTAYTAVNKVLVQTYWQVGRHIVEYEQQGKEKADYGSKLLDTLSKDLTLAYGKGFSRSHIIYMRKLYLCYPQISESPIHQLSWTHFIELLKIDDELERSFYEQQAIRERWSVRELKRQKNTALFQRLALSRDKEGILKLSKEGQIPDKPKDVIRDPYILEFLKIPEDYRYSETELEQKIIDHLQLFLLELGKGFAFIGRQYRITLANRHFKVDLVFYHRILKCFVLFDLKINEVEHGDVGQMNLYLNYFKKEENMSDDNEPIGVILTAHKDEVIIEYALGGLSNQIFISKYQLYLPDKQVLQEQIQSILEQE